MDMNYDVLLVSQFTLHANLKKGSKPDFHNAMAPEPARLAFDNCISMYRDLYKENKIQTGSFGEYMAVSLENDGPVTFVIDRLREMRAEWDQMFELKVPKVRIIPPEERRGDPYDGKVETLPTEAYEAVDSGGASRSASPKSGMISGKIPELQTKMALQTAISGVPGAKTPQIRDEKRVAMPRPSSISPIDLKKISRGGTSEQNLTTPRQDQSVDITTSRQQDKESVSSTARLETTRQPLMAAILEPPGTPRQDQGLTQMKDDKQEQKREPRFTLEAKQKLSLRQGALVNKVMTQLKGLQNSIATRKAKELSSMDLIKKHVIGGSYFMKLEGNGSSTACLVGVGGKDAVTFWWEKQNEDITAIPLGELVRIDYGIDSNCFRSLQNSKRGELRNVLPWNCFTVVFKNLRVDFFADRRESCRVRTDSQTGKHSLMTNYSLSVFQPEAPLIPAIERLAEIDLSVETFLYGFGILFRKEKYERGSIKTLADIPGMVSCMTHLRLRRAVIKLDYVSTAIWDVSSKQVSPLNLSAQQNDSVPATYRSRRSSISQRAIEILEPTPRIQNQSESRGNYLEEAKARLRCWKIPEEALGPNVLKQLKGLHKTLEVRKVKEHDLYSLVDRQVLGGTYLLKVEEEVINDVSRPKTIPCLVGIGGDESVTFWWEFVGGNVVTIPLDRVESVEYGVTSLCYKLLQKARTGDMLNVLPWNCFTVRFSANRFVNFCSDRRRRAFVKIDKNGKRSLVTNRATDTFKRDPIIIESAERLGEVDDDIEKFLFGFAVCFRQERSERPHMRFVGHVPGLPMSYNQLRLRRAVIKMEYVQNLTAEDLADLLN